MPSWSPDGARIAFIKYGYLRNSDCIEDDRIGLYVMDADGANVRKITAYRLPQRVLYPPIWSPNGDSLAYVLAEYVCGEYRYGNEEEKTALYTVGVDGSGLKLLAKMESLRPPSWSPDGQRIAFGVAGGDGQGTYTIRPDGTGMRRVHDEGARQIAWSPDGLKMLVDGAYVLQADGSKPDYIASFYGTVGAWSPNGSRIAVYRSASTIPALRRSYQSSELYSFWWLLFTIAPDGTDAHVLVGHYDVQGLYQGLYVCDADGKMLIEDERARTRLRSSLPSMTAGCGEPRKDAVTS